MLNLLVNANKFSNNGEISVHCELIENSNFIKISVRDRGIGIKDEDKEKLFVPFELLDDGIALNPSGTGIGLSSCQKMLTAIGCSI